MLPDLPTLLLVRLGVDALIAVAFWGQMRRYPGIPGPGWWSLGAVLSIVSSVLLMVRVGGAGPLAAGLTGLVMFASNACAWVGLRAYLKLPAPWRPLTGMLVFQLVMQLGLALGSDQPAGHQMVHALTMTLLVVLVLRDLLRERAKRLAPEYGALAALTVFELAMLLGVTGWVAFDGSRLDRVGSGFLLLFLLTKFLRVLLFSALVSLRLRQEADQARQAMAERAADSRALITNLGAGVVVFRPDRSIVSANTAARRFFDWPLDGPQRASPDRPLLREDGIPMPRHETPFERVLASGQPVGDVVGGIRIGDGAAVRWALCNAYPENDAIGGLRHVVLTFVDITSLKQAQQQQRALELQLSQSHKMEALGTLAGGVAHDFNNILAAILGNADLARQDLDPGSPARESLHEISSAARRGRELVRQILAFSRQQPLSRTPVCLRDVVTETTSLLRTALTPQIQLTVDVAATTPAIRADATQLGQVLLNLGTNAIHALEGRTGGIAYRVRGLERRDPALPQEVAQACEENGVDAVCVSVSDDGCGMNDTTQQRMFEPFFTTKAVGRGTGLGLPVVLGIVQAHGGAIEVDSEPGRGTTFHLYFPAATALPTQPTDGALALAGTMAGTVTPMADTTAQPQEQHEMADTSSATQRHILYLDDDDTLVFLVRRLLERRGYKVTAFTEQQQAIDAVRADPQGFHLLMTDYNMPGMSGVDVARAVRAIRPDLPVAVASGYISDELQAEAAAAGVTEVVFKTDAVEAFCEIVARLVTPAHPA
ncbi:ATP-binding protein [Hydrogenophaga sp.]|uniref:hybrid sensor histidine kinase/response regulator n=1 Tax=Hydrogenophaga sp. TaxID=1904254 RepID=UPI00286DF645|nr:ATP-binding protein [Hydrogenophaga sp.]